MLKKNVWVVWASRCIMLLCVTFTLPGGVPAQENAEVPRVWVYRNVPAEGETDKRTASERHFTPYFFFPESRASRIVVDTKRPISDISKDEEGTCTEFVFQLEGADDFAGAGWIAGDRLGDKLPLNVIDQGLVVGFGRPVYLKFRARTVAHKSAKVRFESCGLAAGKVRDGILPSQTPDPDLTVLSDSWKDVTIELTKKAGGLEKVASPLRVVVRANDNPGSSEVTVFVDDVRFEVGSPTK